MRQMEVERVGAESQQGNGGVGSIGRFPDPDLIGGVGAASAGPWHWTAVGRKQS